MSNYSPIMTRSKKALQSTLKERNPECKNCNNSLMKIGSLEDKVDNLEHNNAHLSVNLQKLNADFDTFQDLIVLYRRVNENSNDENKRLHIKNNVSIILLVVVCIFLIGLVVYRSEEHTSELQSQSNLVCRLLLEKKKKINVIKIYHKIKTSKTI